MRRWSPRVIATPGGAVAIGHLECQQLPSFIAVHTHDPSTALWMYLRTERRRRTVRGQPRKIGATRGDIPPCGIVE